ncbi:MAG: glycosyltransferase family 4 protein [Opitutaceae bacterium]
MKVLYFHQHFSTPDGATGTRSYEFARALVARGHKVTMVCGRCAMSSAAANGGSSTKGRRVIEGIEVVELPLAYSNHDSLPKRAVVFLRFAWRSVLLALREEYDLLFATSTPLTAGIPGIVMRFFRRKPFVFEVRDLWPELPKAMGVVKNPAVLYAMSALEWLSYRASDACVGLSPGIVEGIKRRSKRGHRVEMIPNACDLELFKPGDRARLDIPGIARTDMVAVFTGAHGIANGLDAVLDAAGVLQRRARSDIKIVFIGDGKLKPHLLRRVRAEKLDNCIFLDPMPKRRLKDVVANCDVGLMILSNIPAFYFGTSPNKFFDYLASGLPVINNYPGWLGGLISEHDCGVMVHPGDPQAFADALETLADRPERRREMGRNARALGAREFSRARLAARFVDWLEGVIDEGRRRTGLPEAISSEAVSSLSSGNN